MRVAQLAFASLLRVCYVMGAMAGLCIVVGDGLLSMGRQLLRRRAKLFLQSRRVLLPPVQPNDGASGLAAALVPVLVLGDSGVGKTALCRQLMCGHCSEQPCPTVASDLSLIHTAVDGQPLVVQLWDTAGRGAADLLGPRFFRSAACAVLVCNLQQHHCVSSLSFWQAVVAGEDLSKDQMPCLVVACTAPSRELSTPGKVFSQAQEQQVRAWCQELDVPLFVVQEQQDPMAVQQLFRAVVSEGHRYAKHRQPGCSADVPGPAATYRPV